MGAGSTIAATLWARTIIVLPPLAVALAVIAALAVPLGEYLGVGARGLALVAAYFLATALAQTAGALSRATD